jgi:hypothetical protein
VDQKVLLCLQVFGTNRESADVGLLVRSAESYSCATIALTNRTIQIPILKKNVTLRISKSSTAKGDDTGFLNSLELRGVLAFVTPELQ